MTCNIQRVFSMAMPSRVYRFTGRTYTLKLRSEIKNKSLLWSITPTPGMMLELLPSIALSFTQAGINLEIIKILQEITQKFKSCFIDFLRKYTTIEPYTLSRDTGPLHYLKNLYQPFNV